MSSKKDSTASNGSATKYEARLCHVVKRPDFDGYGFNLHAEKGRPGQYIGKVDDGSPAEAAGLRQGDRIVEVNGTNITTETHKKVVELIKGVPNETKLLVIDPRADAAEMKAAIAKSKSGTNGVDVNDNSKQQPAAAATEKEHHMMTNGTKDSLNENKHDVNGTSNNKNTNEDVNNKKNSSSSSANNNVDTSANKSMMMMTNGDAPAKKQPVDQIIEDTKALSVVSPPAVAAKAMTESNGSTGKPAVTMNGGSGSANGSASTKEGPKLNLSMTAAELRAQLAARKKYDPKNDVCDLRKKYEIIQKM